MHVPSFARSGSALALFAALSLISPAAAPAQKRVNIRSVDFRNFTFPETFSGPKVTVKNGVFERIDDIDQFVLRVLDIVYGDVTGDGVEEAIVLTSGNRGESQQYSNGLVFTMRKGAPEFLVELGEGDRAHGGIHHVSVAKGHVVVERYGEENGSICCPEHVVRTTYVVREGYKRRIELVETGEIDWRGYHAYGGGPGAETVRFMEGGSAAVLAGATNGHDAYRLSARAGQTMKLRLDTKDARATATLAGPSGVVTKLAPNAAWSGKLPAAGEYTVSIASPAGEESTDAVYTIDLEVR